MARQGTIYDVLAILAAALISALAGCSGSPDGVSVMSGLGEATPTAMIKLIVPPGAFDDAREMTPHG